MTIRTIINKTQGVVCSKDSEGVLIEANTTNTGFHPYIAGTKLNITSSITLTAGNMGLHYFSGSAAVTASLPSPTTCPDGIIMFRSLTPFANVLTASGTDTIVGGTAKGTKLVLTGVIGGSVSLQCDGYAYMILGGYGTNSLT